MFPRSKLVAALFRQVQEHAFVLVRHLPNNVLPISTDGGKQVKGTPGSGKTMLLGLLSKHVCDDDTNVIVHVIRSWKTKEDSRSY
jgi:Cdc6-like AAA superfamily ATPase